MNTLFNRHSSKVAGLALLTFLFGCGGSSSPGGGGGGSQSQGVGTYAADFTRSGDTRAVVALQSDGTGSFIYYDVTGTYALAHLSGIWDWSKGLSWSGTDGTHAVNLTGSVSGNPPVFNGTITGPFSTSFVATQIANTTTQTFAGTWDTFSSNVDAVWAITAGGGITNTGTITGSAGTATFTYSGSLNASGYFTLEGTSTLNGGNPVHEGPFHGILLLKPDLTHCDIYFESLGASQQGTKRP